ncbi:MAG: sigma-70 family RNA polymerase sigma factor [Gemmataceae bacterium]|nr:sigma-70 family RNA polymerase sigma factor [Gemmataceae bacterium]
MDRSPQPVDELPTAYMSNLVDRWRAGDRDAANELLTRVGGRLQGIARRMLRRFPGVQRWEDADDVVSEATLRLLRALQAVKPESMRAFYGLATEQIRRQLLDLARHYYGPQGMGTHHESNLHLENSGGDLVPRKELAIPGEDFDEAERWAAFHEAVEKLDAEEREVFGLTFYHGWGQKEIGELIQKDERTVRRRWRKACLELHAMLKGNLPAGAGGLE